MNSPVRLFFGQPEKETDEKTERLNRLVEEDRLCGCGVFIFSIFSQPPAFFSGGTAISAVFSQARSIAALQAAGRRVVVAYLVAAFASCVFVRRPGTQASSRRDPSRSLRVKPGSVSDGEGEYKEGSSVGLSLADVAGEGRGSQAAADSPRRLLRAALVRRLRGAMSEPRRGCVSGSARRLTCLLCALGSAPSYLLLLRYFALFCIFVIQAGETPF